jgi:hypothetical protein
MLMLKNLLLVCLPVVVICFPFVVYYVSVQMGIAPVSMFVYSKCVSYVGNPCRSCFDRSTPGSYNYSKECCSHCGVCVF